MLRTMSLSLRVVTYLVEWCSVGQLENTKHAHISKRCINQVCHTELGLFDMSLYCNQNQISFLMILDNILTEKNIIVSGM